MSRQEADAAQALLGLHELIPSRVERPDVLLQYSDSPLPFDNVEKDSPVDGMSYDIEKDCTSQKMSNLPLEELKNEFHRNAVFETYVKLQRT